MGAVHHPCCVSQEELAGLEFIAGGGCVVQRTLCIGRAVGDRGHDPGPIGIADATAEDEPLLSGPMGRQPVRSARRVDVNVCKRLSTHRAGHAS